MKIRIAFVAIALFAIASAFTTRTYSLKHYKYIADGGSDGWQVENIARTEGTGSGEYQCNNTGSCVVGADDTQVVPTLKPGTSNYFLPKTQSTVITGTYQQF